jgi:hypothetical protein
LDRKKKWNKERKQEDGKTENEKSGEETKTKSLLYNKEQSHTDTAAERKQNTWSHSYY